MVKGWSSLVFFFFHKVLWLLDSDCSKKPCCYSSPSPCLSFPHWEGKRRSSGMTGACSKPALFTKALIRVRCSQHSTAEASQGKQFPSKGPPSHYTNAGTPFHGISLLRQPTPTWYLKEGSFGVYPLVTNCSTCLKLCLQQPNNKLSGAGMGTWRTPGCPRIAMK